MDEIAEFNRCAEEVNRLRGLLLEKLEKENRENALETAVTELAKTQVENLQTISSSIGKFAGNFPVKERLQRREEIILMPGRESVDNFVKFVRNAFELKKEVSNYKNGPLPDRQFFDNQETCLNETLCSVMKNGEFIRDYQGIVRTFKQREAHITSINEVTNSTINTILSDDVSCSSRIDDSI